MALNMKGPACPSCGALITRVVLVKRDRTADHVVRRRHCEFCEHRFYTAQPEEVVSDVRWIGTGTNSVPVVQGAMA